MTAIELLQHLLKVEKVDAVEAAVASFEGEREGRCAWVPLGGRRNNRGTVEMSTDPGRALIERLTNGIDAILELEHERHSGYPRCASPEEAAHAWLGVPSGGLSDMTIIERQNLADRVRIRLQEGSGKDARVVTVEDSGVGIRPKAMSSTILSLNESNKLEKRYLAGTYGQGGSSTFAVSKVSLIASRGSDGRVGFTVVRFDDPPPNAPKVGRYIYLVVDGDVPTVALPEENFPRGTVVRHFGYDLSSYPSPVGPNSVYGLLNQVLFDPVMPVWLDNRIHDYRRVIKGSRNALNGAVDDSEARGPSLSHHVPLFFVDLGEHGRIGIEYWVLEPPTKSNRRPTKAYVDPNRPILLTYNGQNQAELGVGVVRKEADLPFLGYRLVCHVDCNRLSFTALRALFVSNREAVRKGAVLEAIRTETLNVLQSDDELRRLNSEARAQSRREHDEEAAQTMRKEIARLLRMQGVSVSVSSGGTGAESADGRPSHPRPPRPPVAPIPTKDPPTFVRLVWDEDAPITLYGGQRRYIRIETDANSLLHDAADPEKSRFNFVVDSEVVRMRGSTPLKGGRMRAILDCTETSRLGDDGRLRVELARPGYETLSDERAIRIVPAPPPREGTTRLEVPPFQWTQVDGPDDDMWAVLGWPENPDEVGYEAQMQEGQLVIYYSTVFPRFLGRLRTLENRSADQAASFQRRYEIWLAVHALLLHNDERNSEAVEDDTSLGGEEADKRDHAERRRVATLSVLMAVREATEEVAAV